MGNASAFIFVSWTQSTSQSAAASHGSTRGMRALSEATFQVEKRMGGDPTGQSVGVA